MCHALILLSPGALPELAWRDAEGCRELRAEVAPASKAALFCDTRRARIGFDQLPCRKLQAETAKHFHRVGSETRRKPVCEPEAAHAREVSEAFHRVHRARFFQHGLESGPKLLVAECGELQTY
ncbi:MAG TPA: hypothetical protein VK181_05380 [Rhizobium sp.]|nr:hypothetical protein [Rhizobium sp.]